MSILSKDKIKSWILPHLPSSLRGKQLKTKEQLQIVSAIFYRLKTGCQWRELPMEKFFSKPYSYKSVFYHFNKWSKLGVWEKIWLSVLSKQRRNLDMSSVQLDGSQSRCYKAREAVGFQGRKQSKTTNLLFLCDNQGVLLACSPPIAGKHHDSFEIEQHFSHLIQMLDKAQITSSGLFLNADAGFDQLKFRSFCQQKGILANIPLNPRKNRLQDFYFDEKLYQKRNIIERTFAQMDAFKALLIRFETSARNWLAYNIIAIFMIGINKLC